MAYTAFQMKKSRDNNDDNTGIFQELRNELILVSSVLPVDGSWGADFSRVYNRRIIQKTG